MILGTSMMVNKYTSPVNAKCVSAQSLCFWMLFRGLSLGSQGFKKNDEGMQIQGMHFAVTTRKYKIAP